MNQIENIYFFVMLVSVIITIISLRYAITIKRYLERFTLVSKKVSNKELHARLNISAKGELGELTNNFNSMIENMSDTIEEVEYKHLQLKSILKSISHGILAIDINGNILLINDEAKKIIKSDSNQIVEGKNIAYAIKEEKILKVISKFRGSNTNETTKIIMDDETVYKIKVDPVYLQNTVNVIIGSIINIEDITEKVKLENMRSDFVANVTHELKTPLTSISGFVETLKLNENIDPSTRSRFLGIIESESDRLKRLIDDILLLSSIENTESRVLEKINLYNTFNEVKEMLSFIAKSKDIEFKYEFEDESLCVESNRDYIKQVFLNLTENAIKYTPDHGEVKVIVSSNDEDIFINVIDNGIGIPKDDIQRIFERFYRVDKARSRDVGGTGLGLAITKHIIKSLHGKIEVKSELNKGSEFIVTIPKKIS
ncbi:HAMP domain-containing sensor histidine kinase [Romboutsia sp. 1001713B170207_170306_H8]|uniref:HAMP domain-containing sensor histidine kinase n=1 Tax=Romboutsia sp. 1001713B170207_170306_H8 TaxID=2787112 RepID=UPI0008213FBF|nr:HAMP domain-containing sensor histidine kinase [Romboutsia sp. 1001713B170207_170306_H8]SCH15085.1 Alkaline phosphatase synthesis sensor protein phoR [uncultured Clostridium sp.]